MRAHRLMRRGLVFSHRDLDRALDDVEAGRPVYLYTGRGPSSGSIHLGHVVPFEFTAFLQRALRCHLVIMMSDDETLVKSRPRAGLRDELRRMARENLRDILGAVSLDPERTTILHNLDDIAVLYPTACAVSSVVTLNQVTAAFGVAGGDASGRVFFASVQAAAALSACFPHIERDGGGAPVRCLIPAGVDQDPYFRVCRDIAGRMRPRMPKPSCVYSKFLPGLRGVHTKMSSSVAGSAVFLDATDKAVRRLVNRSVTGGRATAEEQERLGADLDADVPLAVLRFFLEDDDELARVERLYGPGDLAPGERRLSSGDIKRRAADVIVALTAAFRRRRAALTDADMAAFCAGNQAKLADERRGSLAARPSRTDDVAQT